MTRSQIKRIALRFSKDIPLLDRVRVQREVAVYAAKVLSEIPDFEIAKDMVSTHAWDLKNPPAGQ